MENKKKICDYVCNENFFKLSKIERNNVFHAFETSTLSSISKGKHCAFLIDENNKVELINLNCKIHHAEFGLLLKAKLLGYETKNKTLLVVRGTRSGNFTNSRPCLSCYEKCKECEIKNIIYSISENNKKEKLLKKIYL